MTLDAEYFEKIANGTKTVELRLYDEKRRKIKIGDIILFSKRGSDARLRAEVTNLYLAPTFAELLSDGALLARALPCVGFCEAVELMRRFYTAQEELELGTLGIEIKLK